jgi:cobalt/nickel transport system permease protein
MHIPDGAISPTTAMAANAAMLPIWYAAGRRLRNTLASKQVPVLAIGAAFCFTIMMFNIPLPGGTTVHPIGGVLLAILLGPWAAVIGVSVALLIQALFFADGGVFALGANCFAMAFAMPFCGYFVYRVVAGKTPPLSGRHVVAAAVGAYVGVNVAALLVAVLLGIQPALFHDATGRALYFPFGLKATLPAIMLAHLTIAGAAEAGVTGFVMRYLQSTGIPLYDVDGSGEAKGWRQDRLWVGLGILAALSPLGLLATEDAWGEWSAKDLAQKAGYLPPGLAAAEERGWKGFNLLPDYLSDRGPQFYILAAIVGILLICLLMYIVGALLTRRDSEEGNKPTNGPGASGTHVKPGEVPAWMLSSNENARDGDEVAQKRHMNPLSPLRQDFVAKTLHDLAGAAREALLAECYAQQKGMLQSLDPRVKVVALVGFVVLVSCLHRWHTLLGLGATVLLLAVLSKIPLPLLLKRAGAASAFFMGIIALPAALNIVTPGPVIWVLSRKPYLAVTEPGLIASGLLILRMGVAVSCVLLLVLTTRWNNLVHSLRSLCVPRIFVSVLAMTYRYLVVFLQSAEEMFIARWSRTVGRATSEQNRRFLGGVMGALFGKSLALTEEVHAAMLSRGWTGEVRTLQPPYLRTADLVWLAAMGIVAALAMGGELID